jgi:hypothetical protein
MSVTPVGGTLYMNQASPLVTQLHQKELHRPEMVQFLINEDFVQKEKEVEHIIESQEGKDIDPDKEKAREYEMYDGKGKKKKKDEEERQEPEVFEEEPVGKLDIKV